MEKNQQNNFWNILFQEKEKFWSEAVQNYIVSADSVTEFYLWEGLLKCLVAKLSISSDFPWLPSFLR